MALRAQDEPAMRVLLAGPGATHRHGLQTVARRFGEIELRRLAAGNPRFRSGRLGSSRGNSRSRLRLSGSMASMASSISLAMSPYCGLCLRLGLPFAVGGLLAGAVRRDGPHEADETDE